MQICNIQRSLKLNIGAGGQWTPSADDRMRRWLLTPKRCQQGQGPLLALPPIPQPPGSPSPPQGPLLALPPAPPPPAPAAADDGIDTGSSSTSSSTSSNEEEEEGDKQDEGGNHSDNPQEDGRVSSLPGDAAQGITDEQVMDHPLYVNLLDGYSELEKEAAYMKRKVEEQEEAAMARVLQCQKYEEEIEELKNENKRLKAKAE